MLDLILSSESDLVCYGASEAQTLTLTKICSEKACRLIVVDKGETFIKKVKGALKFTAFIIIGKDEIKKEIHTMKKRALFLPGNVKKQDLESQTKAFLDQSIPSNLTDLIKSMIVKIPSEILKLDLKPMESSSEFNTSSHWSFCDSLISKGIFLKATCEMDLNGLRESYSELAPLADKQLIDASGEICNQLLGAINSQLRHIGFAPVINLPIRIQSSKTMRVTLSESIKYVRYTDKHKKIAVGIIIQIDPSFLVEWEKLPKDIISDEIEFF